MFIFCSSLEDEELTFAAKSKATTTGCQRAPNKWCECNLIFLTQPSFLETLHPAAELKREKSHCIHCHDVVVSCTKIRKLGIQNVPIYIYISTKCWGTVQNVTHTLNIQKRPFTGEPIPSPFRVIRNGLESFPASILRDSKT